MDSDAVHERWATFDCYGTLIDWNRGIGDQLALRFGARSRESLLALYHELEPQVQAARPSASYREVLSETLARCAQAVGQDLAAGDRDALARSLPGWPVFADVPAALVELRRRGWRLAILSNTDRDFIEASMGAIGVPFELAIVASEIGSYKPAHGHWRAFAARTDADPKRHVHVAASPFHDVRPASELGIPCVWINRLGEPSDPPATLELAHLGPLPAALERLVPSAPSS